MQKNLQWKILSILVIVVLAVWAVYPPGERIRLGLDLEGGVHLVMRVQTEDALEVETETAAEQLGEQLSLQGFDLTSVLAEDGTTIRVSDVPATRDQEFRQITDERLSASYNRESGPGGSYLFRMRAPVESSLREESVRQAIETIERRVNELGVAEPIVAPHGIAGNQILVQLPGVSDVVRAKELIRSTALLELKLVEEGPAPSRELLLDGRSGVVPPDMEVVTGQSNVLNPGGTAEPLYYLVRRVAAVTGRDLRNARPSLDEFNQPAVSFTLNREGALKFGDVTGQNIGRSLAIILDGQVRSAPVLQARITDSGQITGVSQQEAEDLQITLRSGALPASLTYLEERTVGPTLGADSIRAGVTASIAGLILVAFFMLIYYKRAGINAVVAVGLNLVILMGCMAYVDAVLTLPGIAGLILTIGIGVDSNVLIFERIKEELGSAKSVRNAVSAGFDRVLLTIIDTHVASLISAAFLFQFGSGPIKGFATTLFFGLVSNVFTAVFVSRTMFEVILSRRRSQTLSI